jgi:hypothetical protein
MGSRRRESSFPITEYVIQEGTYDPPLFVDEVDNEEGKGGTIRFELTDTLIVKQITRDSRGRENATPIAFVAPSHRAFAEGLVAKLRNIQSGRKSWNRG